MGGFILNTLKIIKEELERIYSSKTLDALLPPFIFVISQNIFNLKIGLIIAILSSLLVGFIRILKGQKILYALAGSLGVAVFGGYAYYTQSVTSYFLPKLITSGLGAVVAFLSLLFRKPIAAYLSHLSRGWPIEWFWHQDVKPAYTEVSFSWGLLFLLRLFILFTLYNKGEVWNLLWLSTLLGTPATIIVLILTYLYGSYRLKKLKGPSVDEFLKNKQPPYQGQNRGF